MQPLNIILIGRSGSGKGTQAELLRKLGDFYYLSSGDLFRDLGSQKSETGKKVKEIVDSGVFPPDELATALWMRDLAYHLTESQGILMDGAPRKLWEAEHLDRFLEFLGRFRNTKAVLIDISRDEAFKRLKLRARSDDTDEAIASRLDFFDEDVTPVVEHYDQMDMLLRIDGEREVAAIHEDLVGQLGLKEEKKMSDPKDQLFTSEPL